MNTIFLEKWTEFAKKAQEPIRAITELNLKTLQSFHYLKPEDFVDIKKPEEYFEKQIQLVIENGHKALDHMAGSFQIMEKAMLSMAEQVKEKSQEVRAKVVKESDR